MTGELNGDAIIGDYRALIEDLKLSPQEIHDESELPHARQRIIDALVEAYSLSGKSFHSPARLQGWLLTLAQFQPDVGEPIRDPAAETARRMAAAGHALSGAEAQKLAADIAEESVERHWAIRRARLQPKVAKERDRLIGLLHQVR
jgi:hypothetical protein